MTPQPIERADDPRLVPYRAVGDPELLRAHALFVAEGRFVVERLVRESPFRPHSLLVSPASARALAPIIDSASRTWPVYVAPPALLEQLTGYDFHRGCLALAHRPTETEAQRRLDEALERASLVVALDNVGNADNVGAILRNAEAFGAGAAVLSPTTCDPLYRRAIRVSMGAALRLPAMKLASWLDGLEGLRRRGFTLMALTPDGETPLTHAPLHGVRLVLIAGAEGSGLPPEVLARADLRVRIPMAPHVDSLNVATATGIALHWCFQSR